MNPVKDIVIVGGGTAGLTTALILQSKSDFFNIKVIKSSKEGIIGVGEGTTPEWYDFIQYTGIDFKEVVKETEATVKVGILFNDWNYKNHSYVHALISDFELSIYDYLVLNSPNKYPLSFYFEHSYLQNKIPVINNHLGSSKQYHFDTFKLNKFLTKKCKERNIIIEDHFIEDVNITDKNKIQHLITSENKIIKGDFFVDCSGFKRILISKLGAKWISYRDKLPVNQAITFATPLNFEKGIEPYTTATALSSGWVWKIPTQSRYGNGYVFDNRYIDEDNALNELNQHLNTNIEKVAKSISFEAGKVDKFWINNCVAIGLAGSFMEPLEAQSIGYSIKQAFTVADNLFHYHLDSNTPKFVNKRLDNSFSNTLDMVQIHYLTKRNDSKFWKDKPFNLTTSNKEGLKLYSLGIFNSNFQSNRDVLFDIGNFYQILYGLDILTKEKLNLKYNKYFPFAKEDLEHGKQAFIDDVNNVVPNINLSFEDRSKGKGLILIDHFDYLNLLKENYSF